MSAWDEDVYAEELLDHYYSSPRRGHLEDPDVVFEDENPLCGDRVRVEVKFDDDRIADIRFDGEGCVISQASASLVCEEAAGKPREEVRQWDLKKVLDLIGIELTPVRMRCALLPLKVLQAALAARVRGGTAAESPSPKDGKGPTCAH